MAKHYQLPTARPVKDTRGLPLGLDPRRFYEYASQLRRRNATGVELLLYKLMPYSLIKSLAFAIDPLSRFKVSATRISPANRTRTRRLVSALQLRSYVKHYVATVAPYKYLPGGYRSESTYESTQVAQPSLKWKSVDITAKDRPIGSEMGEFSKWKVQTYSPPRSRLQHEHLRRWYDSSPSGYWYILLKDTMYTGKGPAAYITEATVDALQTETWSRAEAVMQKHVLPMYKNTSVLKQSTTLFRNIVELRDLPRGIIQLRDSFVALRNLSESLKIPKKVLERIHSFKTTGLAIPKEYLSYQFGWAQTYRDVRDLLLAPDRISKRVNFLIRRNGKATTYRTQRTYSEDAKGSSGFIHSRFPSETVIAEDTNVHWDHTLKMVINTTFEFPDVDLPSFREKEFYRQLGVVPSPTDLYNLVPWTWLFDWFTGFGNYVEIIDSVNSDDNLINWGLLTCNTEGNLTTTYVAKLQDADTWGTDPTRFTYPRQSHQSHLMFSSQVRRDVSTILNVKTTGDTSTLSTYQLSILGAILSSRAKF